MELKRRIEAFVALGKFLDLMARKDHHIEPLNNSERIHRFTDEIDSVLQKATSENGWFTLENIKFALKNWADALTQENIQDWLSKYVLNNTTPKQVGIVMAGNVPLVGFHDFLSVLITGNSVLAKLSSNDKTLLPFLADYLVSIEPHFKEHITFTEERLQDFDAVIATGSNNTSRYFDYYFGKYPHIIRKNRNSVAVLSGNETQTELRLLADDIFRYFGLGCRNVSKLYIPQDYDFEPFFKAMFSWKDIIHNNKYINNYDYNKAVYLMDNLPLLDNEFLLLKEDQGFHSPISVVFYKKYNSLEEVKNELIQQSEALQCIVSNVGIRGEIPFGKTQTPQLWDYADNVDTVDFLLKLT